MACISLSASCRRRLHLWGLCLRNRKLSADAQLGCTSCLCKARVCPPWIAAELARQGKEAACHQSNSLPSPWRAPGATLLASYLARNARRRYESDMPSALGVADIFADVPSHM